MNTTLRFRNSKDRESRLRKIIYVTARSQVREMEMEYLTDPLPEQIGHIETGNLGECYPEVCGLCVRVQVPLEVKRDTLEEEVDADVRGKHAENCKESIFTQLALASRNMSLGTRTTNSILEHT
jgi:hypothetical protein